MKRKTKIISVIAALIVIISAVAAAAYYELSGLKPIEPKETVSISASSVKDLTKIKMIAHRGLSATAPENTLAAFKAACDAGYYGVEYDIQLTGDGVWVVSHDPSLKRMTGENIKIAETELSDLKKISYNNGANIDKYDGITIPTLEETLALVSQYGIVSVIEIKTGTADKIDELMALLEKYKILDKVRIISFNEEPLKKVKELSGQTPVSYLTDKVDESVIELCKNDGFEAVSFNKSKCGEDSVRMITDAGLIPQCWTVDKISDFEKFAGFGVEYFTSNCLLPAEK
ncbi:MAG: glycerophosphodiester phosphodiesterase [Acutalibacteraceae bacterium]